MKTYLPLLFLLVLGACQTLMPTAEYKKALCQPIAQKWSGGAPGSGRGVIFTVKFYQLNSAFEADTLLVNGVPLAVSRSQVGDTIFLLSTFDTMRTEERTLANDTLFKGQLLLHIGTKKHKLSLGEFKLLPPLNFP